MKLGRPITINATVMLSFRVTAQQAAAFAAAASRAKQKRSEWLREVCVRAAR